ncbi:capsule biosynthesis protein [Sulfitobacter pacificus]|uniref:Capsule polysaccharide transporter n=1 Tax=Sulfitobacter pacificus TaxID=1499314 RepID=A0ABQ5VK20_9RHOB|nr:capsule biosynthesis protein [Sulfitobacter pacificus]GLQ27468.1 capsule polysaccharide transporter [Sulfitobacter pacificus]
MTTKPKARKFRIKRNTPTSDAPRQSASAAVPKAVPDPQQPQAQPEAAAPSPAPTPPQAAQPAAPSSTPPREGAVSSAAEVAGETDIDAIRREGLTGRQLRMARRVAQKHDLAPISDFDAVRLLRAKGIDPFERSNMLELVVPQGDGTDGSQQLGRIETTKTQLPQTVPAGGSNLPATEVSPAERRALEISQIQRDISKRRRRKLGLLLVRLAFFVMLPTIAAGYYFYNVATPMYATNSQFLIIQSEGGGGASPFGSILPTQFANSADSIATQAYLQSKDAMLRLDQDVGFKDHFSDEAIDPIQRLEAGATNEEAYKTYKKNVKIGYDPTEGVIRLEVIAGDPNVSASFSESLIKYAEERVNNLSKQKREDGMRDALAGFDTAQQKRRDAQEALIRMQVENGVDPQAEIVAIRTQITTYEGLLIEKELELSALLDNARPNQAKVDGARGDVRRLEEQLEKLKEKMSTSTTGENSLAEQSVRMQLAQTDLAAADMVLQSAQTAMDQARSEAGRQVRYLTVAVEPVAPQEPTYPRKFENTILAFLIFAGIYLMLSLTASILREQVTS